MHVEREMSVSSSSYKATSPIGSDPTFMTLFSLNYLLKALSSNIVKLGVRTPNIRTWGENSSAHRGVHVCIYKTYEQ